MTDRLLGDPSAPEGRDAARGVPDGQGRLVGRRYRLLSPVGRGGMGMVWHAHDVLLDRDVAVKELILPFGLDHSGKQVAHRRMMREARSAARLSHPGIVTVHDVVEEDGRPWIVMELVRAWSLEQAVRTNGPLSVLQAAEIGIRVLDALRHAHAAGILHRDIKPGNVLLTTDRVVLTDFGIAAIEGDVTITQTGLLMGSPAYIPPERLQGHSITQAADLWSFGATLYAAVEGRPPYEGPDAVAVLGAVLTQEPSRPERAGALLPVIEGLLRKNPADRISAEQVADLLERILRTHGSTAAGHTTGSHGVPVAPHPADSYAQYADPLAKTGDALPVHLMPPLDPPPGPMPSRIIETPSGPVRVPYDPGSGGYETPSRRSPAAETTDGYGRPVPYDPFSGPTGTYSTNAILRPVQPLGAPYDAMSSPSGPLPTTGYDAFGSPSGPQPGTGPQRHDDFGGPSGPHRYDDFGGPSGPQPTAPPGFDAFGSTSGPQQAAPAFDAFTGPSGPHPGTGAGPRRAPGQDAAFGGPSGPHRFDAFGGPSGPQPAAAPGFDAFGSASGPQTQPRMGGTTPGTTAPTGPGATGAPPTGPGATGAPPAGRINSGAFEAIRAARANRDPGFPVGGDTRQADPGTRSGGTGGRGDGPGARTGGARRTGTTGEIPRVGARGRAAAEEGRARGAARRDEGRARGGGRGDFGRPPRRRPDGGTWFRHGRPTPRLLLAAAGTAGAVLLAVLLLRAGGSGEEPARFTSSAAPTAQTSQTSQQPVSGTGEVPEGYKARTQIGVTVTVPEDWKVSATDTKATFSDPDGGQQTITVEKAPSASDGGLATLGEEREKSELAEYIQVQLQPVTWGSWRAADWEYTHTLSNGVPAHTLTRFVTVDAERAYKITFSAPDLKWDEGAEIRETFFAGFTPA